MVILAIEASTSSAKALIYDGDVKVMVEETFAYTDLKKQDPHKMIEVVFDCAEKALDSYNQEPIDCIVLSTVWSSLLLCDKAYQPVTEISTWADITYDDYIKRYREDQELWAYAYKNTGCNIHSKYPLWRLMAMKDAGDLQDDFRVSSVAEWIYYNFTGQVAVSDIMASGTGLFNLNTQTYDHHLMELLGLEEEQLSKIHSFRTSYLTSKATMKRLKLHKKVPVFIPNGDGGLNHISEMDEAESVISLSIGTSGAIRVDGNKPLVSPDKSLWSHYLSEGRYISGGTISGAGSLVNWFMNALTEKVNFEHLETSLKGCDIQQAPIFLPFIYGEQSIGWSMETYGGFYDRRTMDKLEVITIDYYYSVLEGISFNLKQCYDKLCEADESIANRIIKVSGGITESQYWLQLLCDILNKPIHISQRKHQSLMGAVKVAYESMMEQWQGVGQTIGSFEHMKFVSEMETVKCIAPKTDVSVYEARYKQYLDLYEVVKRS